MDFQTALEKASQLKTDHPEDSEFYEYVIWAITDAKYFRTRPSHSNRIRLEGKWYGQLKVIEEVPPIILSNGDINRAWLCRCKCGNYKITTQAFLKEGRDCSCGCETEVNDIIGKKFNMLTVLEKEPNKRDTDGHMRSMYLCKCDCGKIVVKNRKSLTSGKAISCGCMRGKPLKMSEQDKKIRKKLKTTYRGMINRCYNPETRSYKWYGAQGITICDEWLGDDGFDNFLEWSVNNGCSVNLSIDRIDVNSNYSPENCRWVDMKTQQRNKRNTHYITYNGDTKCMGEWAEIYGIKYNVLCARINKGWDVEKAITTPIKERRKEL